MFFHSHLYQSIQNLFLRSIENRCFVGLTSIRNTLLQCQGFGKSWLYVNYLEQGNGIYYGIN